MSVLLLAVPAVPLVLALALAGLPRARVSLVRVAPLAVAPGIIAAVIPEPASATSFSWLLLGTQLDIDDTGRVFLLFSSAVWLAALVYADAYLRDDPRRNRFTLFLLLTMAGNMGVLVAADAVTFYMSFAVMSFATYGLVVHEQTDLAHRASRVYISMVIVGEFALLVGVLLAVQAAGTTALDAIPAAVAADRAGDVIVALLLLGFGIKLGVLFLHMWLPLAHPAAPTPASAVLSAVLIKVGLLGFLRFIPFGDPGLDGWGTALIVIGFAGAFLAVIWGICQVDLKANLAYSSVSQMGVVTAGAGIALAEPVVWPAVLVALLVYAVHHSFAKAALFLGTGLVRHPPSTRWLSIAVPAGLVIAAIALAGAPFTTGALAKALLKEGAHLGGAWDPAFTVLFFCSSAATTLLMARFLWLARDAWQAVEPAERHDPPLAVLLSWCAVVVGSLIAAWIVPVAYGLDVSIGDALKPAKIADATWPVLAGVAIASGAVLLARRGARMPMLPMGDAAGPLEWAAVRLIGGWRSRAVPALALPRTFAGERSRRVGAQVSRENLARVEARLSEWTVFCVVFTAAVIVFFGLAR